MSTRRGAGFTLIELVMFIVIVSIGLAGVLLVFDTVTRRSADPIRAKQAMAVAEGMMDEILSKKFCDPDTVSTATTPVSCGVHTTEAARDLFDDVDDYNGYVRADIRDVSSDATVVLPGYNVAVTTQAPSANFVVGADAVAPANYRIVTVSVTDTVGNQTYDVTAYKFNND